MSPFDPGAIASLQTHHCFGGTVGFYEHDSRVCGCPMRFSLYAPPQMQQGPRPVLYFLSGLTCTEENFMVKAGAQRFAAELGLCLVVPDTSPRHTGIPDEDTDWVYGSGAGFYLNATQDPWKRHYQMYSYVVEELPILLAQAFAVDLDRQGIMGHSMGGHGALVIGLRNGDRYRSISALAPICHPIASDWTRPAFERYLGDTVAAWKDYDATELLKRYVDPRPLLVDQGLSDPFLQDLMPQSLAQACAETGRSLTLRQHPDYDHSYYFIASLIEDHLRHHAQFLCPGSLDSP
ncbi:S-formylglutathione hydrolase [Lyngbya confervoides]|uniref:S-formylglutathione hydrolase n=1 Tax=Lyngbya confervoides BDU141951 TaxID=1574623 RepID=A0ABD4T7V8_9CYAN|nr:S-formylglutathione hydrolase [Lyngbya confervoides]MCM1984530.1 S-formylglutathione hydrolase [Lyngbya confervoides BDU141951]